jgi:hypothetical protein
MVRIMVKKSTKPFVCIYGETLQSLREERKWSRGYLARRTRDVEIAERKGEQNLNRMEQGLSEKTIQEIENTRNHSTEPFKKCESRTLRLLANALELDNADLLCQLRGRTILASVTPEITTFLHAYRKAFVGLCTQWHLPVPARLAGTVPRRETALHTMYIALRLAEGFDLKKLSEGNPVTPVDLLKRTKHLMIRGLAGAGKTTWMHWTFGQLLEEPEAFPVLIELRRLTDFWSEKKTEADRSLETFLARKWLADHGLAPHQSAFDTIVKLGCPGVKPILLVDGWDELGDFGDEVHGKLLGLMAHNPDTLVVVSSRPHGKARPIAAENFQELDLQPLNDEEVASFAGHFFKDFCRMDASESKQAQDQFLRNRAAIENLSRVPLHLSMLLAISRIAPIPDERFKLYAMFIDALLVEIPEHQARRGTKLEEIHYPVSDTGLRRRAVETIAFFLQSQGKQCGERSTRAPADQLEKWLPEKIPADKRQHFLNWLADRAGILEQTRDNTMGFYHLSFQDYMAARHLKATRQDPTDAQSFLREHISDTGWWETIRLWAALIADENPDLVQRLMNFLLELGDPGLCLAGCISSDGLAEDHAFVEWLDRFVQVLLRRWPAPMEYLLGAWKASRQEQRRTKFVDALQREAPRASWLSWVRLDECSRELESSLCLPQSNYDNLSKAVTSFFASSNDATSSAAALAFLRGFSIGNPCWPGQPLALLALWPSSRYRLSSRLQLLLNLPGGREFLHESATGLQRFLSVPPLTHSAREWARHRAHDLARDWPFDWARDWARDWGLYLARDWGDDWAHEGAYTRARDWAREWARDWARDWTGDSARDWTRDWTHARTRDWARDWAQFLAKHYHLQLNDLTFSLVCATWQSEVRFVPPRVEIQFGEKHSIMRSLFARAIGISRRQHPPDDEFRHALERCEKEVPLWPALARWLARCPKSSDERCLRDCASNPDSVQDETLRLGLQFLVRGDVMFPDGAVKTFDDICAQVGVDPPPLLEPMSD